MKNKCSGYTKKNKKCEHNGKYFINNKHFCTNHYVDYLITIGKMKRFENVSEIPFDKLRFEILKRDEFKCVYCGRNPIEDSIKLHIEHMHSIKEHSNLKYEKDNLVTACEDCNLGKHSSSLEEKDVLLILKRINKIKLMRGNKNMHSCKVTSIKE